jgi:hypothetical protein
LSPAAQKALDVQMARSKAEAPDQDLAAATAAEGLSAPSWLEGQGEKSLLRAFDVLDERRKAYEACANAANTRERIAEERARQLDEQQLAVQTELQKAADASAEAEAMRCEAAGRIAVLDERETRIREREEEAERGFESRAVAAKAGLDAELKKRREEFERELTAQREREETDTARREDDFQKHREARLSDVSQAEEELRGEQAKLEEREDRLRYDQGALRGRELSLENREQAFEAEVAARAAAAVADAQREQHLSDIKADAAERLTADLTQRLKKAEEALLKFGTSDPEGLLDELERLRGNNTELRDRLAARLNDDDLDRLRSAEARNRELSAERERHLYELQQLKGNILANSINNLQVRQLEDAQHQYQVVSRGYEARIAELKRDVEQLYGDRGGPGTPLFPQCAAMDDDPALSVAGSVLDERIDLSRLTLALQSTMFQESERAYRVNDIAVFLGGLAMSRLHLLEGMSGIGKTSLPKAFANALHTDCVVVEVQAGWRDRTDLFGHHNTFEQRFEESDFLQALYRAKTPRYQHRPFFIVLDEMNLSRPEQYFSVMLSKLENDDGKPIQLVGTSAVRPPKLLVGGTSLELPDNVWFIGTANQDESTLEFADKTYNRAHLMELPPHRPWVPRTRDGVQPYSLTSLREAFTRARDQHTDAIGTVRDFVHGLSGDLWEHGRLQMSPRVEEQLRNFVPVVVAARDGGSPKENHDYGDSEQDGLAIAADHFLAYKVLRAVRGRFDVTSERIEALRESVALHWDEAKLAGAPVRCDRMFDEERRRRDG